MLFGGLALDSQARLVVVMVLEAEVAADLEVPPSTLVPPIKLNCLVAAVIAEAFCMMVMFQFSVRQTLTQPKRYWPVHTHT